MYLVGGQFALTWKDLGVFVPSKTGELDLDRSPVGGVPTEAFAKEKVTGERSYPRQPGRLSEVFALSRPVLL